ncbi:3-phosphoshikimate 1-carboxyvinyltransferase [Candidatus Micrarchaeota archaeon]|nr:3-phosphoshikimate 1-carboxyvinyltransferase [Candidatus Micrarchaeota archaeon]
MNILLVGFMGSGKTTVGKALAESRQMAFLDLDAELENQEGKTISTIFQEQGESVFREKESALLKKWAEQQLDNTVISTGGGIVLSDVNVQLIRKMGRTVWLDVSAEEAHRRIGMQDHRPLLQTENPKEKMLQLLDSRKGLYAQAEIRIPVDGKEVPQIVDEINEQLRQTSKTALRERVLSAIGQLEGKTLRIEPSALQGSVKVPASKSITHRALICAALAQKPCRVANVLISDDTLATAAALKVLGATFSGDQVDGSGLFKTGGTLYCGESGSTLRFLLPLACLGQTKNALTGTGRLLQRPIQPLADALQQLGGRVQTTDGLAPITTLPGLAGGNCTLPGDVSSQFVSGLLMALPLCAKPSRIQLTGALESAPYVELTLEVMAHFDVKVKTERDPQGKPTAFEVQPQAYQARDFAVPSDWSSAAFWLVAGSIGKSITIESIAPDSQADAAIVPLLQKMGGKLTIQAGRAKAEKSALSGIEVDVSQCPDLVPILAMAGCFASGTTRLYNAARLRLKESDRLAAVASELRKMGARIEEKPDELIIQQSPLKGAALQSHEDHRIAMALSIAAANAEGPSVIDGADCVAKSYPAFYHDFRALGGKA